MSKTYEIDPHHTEFGFAARHMIVTNVRGTFGDFSGSFNYDPANPTAFSAEVAIKSASITTRNEQRDTHLKSADFLDVEKFPELTFKTTRVEAKGDSLVLHGDLAIRGVTKQITLPVEVNGPVTDPYGLLRVGIEGSTKINRQDWGVAFNGKLATGDLIVSDEIKLTIAVEGTRKAE